MFLFIRLLAGHLIGDFLFQTDEIYSIRKKNFVGSSLHYLIIFVSLLVSAFPYLNFVSCWVVIVLACGAHILQDELKLKIFASPQSLSVFILDQVLHIIMLMPVLAFRYAYGSPITGQGILAAYNNNVLVLVLIGYIIAIFVGAYFWMGFAAAFLKHSRYAYNNQDSKFGMWERALIMTAVLNVSLYLLLLVVVGLRIYFKRRIAAADFVFNLMYASIIGVMIRYVVLY